MEFKCFRLSRSNAEYLECKFIEGEEETVQDIIIGNTVVPKCGKFKTWVQSYKAMERLTVTLVTAKGWSGKNRCIHLEYCASQ